MRKFIAVFFMMTAGILILTGPAIGLPIGAVFALPSVSEPATMLLLGSGLVGVASFGKKKLMKQ